MKRVLIATIMVAFLGAACQVNRSRFAFTAIPGGSVATPGVTIAAEDGSFRLVAGERFQSPFQQDDQCLMDPTSDNYGQALATGARPVVIDLGDGRRFYGLLSLCGAPPTSQGGAAARTYQIQVPEDYLAQTSGGRVSVVFEWFTTSTLQAKSWILWLSETSFSREAPQRGARTTRSVVDQRLGQAERQMRVAKWLGIFGAGFGVSSLYFLTSIETSSTGKLDPGLKGGGFLAFGVVTGISAFGLLLAAPIRYGVGKSSERRVREQLGAAKPPHAEIELARSRASSGPSLGWGWSF